MVSRDKPATRSVTGTIETDEVNIASRYGGRVERVLAQEGDPLTNGQVVVELEAAELESQRAQAAARLAELEQGPRKEEIEAAKHEWEALQADLEFARSDAKRMKELFEQRTVSETDLDRATSRERSLAQNVAAAKARYDLLLAGTRKEQIEQARAQLATIESQLREMRIASPTNCILEVLHVKVGDVLPPNRPVATLILPQQLWVRVYVPELWLAHIQLGEEATVRLESSPDKSFAGVVEQIHRQAEFTPRNVQTADERMRQVFGVKVRLMADASKARPGISAEVFFPNVPAPPR
jgi:multidrug resistance efflux pump